MRAVAGVRGTARTVREVAADQAILNSLAQAALCARDNVVPVAGCELLNVLDAATAASGCDGSCSLVHTTVAGARFHLAARHRLRAVSVSHLGSGSIQDIVAVQFVAAVVEVCRKARGWIQLDRAECRKPMDGRKLSIGANRNVRDCRRAVAANALAPQALQADGDCFSSKRSAEAAADTRAHLLVVVGTCGAPGAGSHSRSSRGRATQAWVNAVAKAALNSKQFPMAPAGLERHLQNKIG